MFRDPAAARQTVVLMVAVDRFRDDFADRDLSSAIGPVDLRSHRSPGTLVNRKPASLSRRPNSSRYGRRGGGPADRIVATGADTFDACHAARLGRRRQRALQPADEHPVRLPPSGKCPPGHPHDRVVVRQSEQLNLNDLHADIINPTHQDDHSAIRICRWCRATARHRWRRRTRWTVAG